MGSQMMENLSKSQHHMDGLGYPQFRHDLTDIRYHIIMAKDQKKEVGSNQARFLKGALNGGHCMALRYIVSEGLREMR